jgi:spore coat protein A, manganese oxidase
VPSVIAESFGDTMLVNGLVFPFVEVEQRKYRFTILNACNARFVRIKIVAAKTRDLANTDSGEPVNYTNPTAVLPMVQIGNEGGFLQAPVTLNGLSPASSLLMAPAERADIIVDFSNIGAGAVLLLYNDAPAPFPSGDDLNDYFPGNSLNPTPSSSGMGPNTRTIMQFRVKARVGAPDRPKPLKLPPFKGSLLPVTGTPYVRKLTLNEDFDTYGRLIQVIGGQTPGGTPYFGAGSTMEGPITNGDTEIWEIYNLTGDTHPMHIHLVNWQIISRQPFDSQAYIDSGGSNLVYLGPLRGPDPNERGWKETVRMNPDEVIRVIAKFDLPDVSMYKPYGGSAITIPESPRFSGQGINEYVWHCHILEHEEHDMMHTLAVT